MERPPWRWNPGYLATSAAVVLCGAVIVVALAIVVERHPPWPSVVLAVVVVAGAGTVATAACVPVRVAVTKDALHLRYLRRSTVLAWRDVTGVLCADDHVSIRTTGRKVRLEHPGTVIVVELLRAARDHGIRGTATLPEGYSGGEPVIPPRTP